MRHFCPVIAFIVLALEPVMSAHPASGIVVDDDGAVYFGDLSRGLLKLNGGVDVVTREGGHWLALDAQGRFSRAEFEKSPHWPRWFKRRTAAGARPTLLTDGGSPLVVGADGNLYFVCDDDRMVPAGLQVGRLTPEGRESLVNPKLRDLGERLGGIKGLAVGPGGTLYASYPEAIVKIQADGSFAAVADRVVVKDCRAGKLPDLRGLAVDADGTIFVAATGCGCVVKIDPTGKTTSVIKADKPWGPSVVALHRGDLYVLEHVDPDSEQHEAWPPRVRKLAKDGNVVTLVDLSR